MDSSSRHSSSLLGFKLGTTNFLTNLAFETSAIYLALYANDLGASRIGVGLIVAAYGISFFSASLLLGRLSDIKGRLRFIHLGLGLSALAYLSQILAQDPLTLMGSRVLVGLSLGTSSGALTAYVYESKGLIGKFTSLGALGWFFGALVAGLVKDTTTLFAVSSLASACGFLMSTSLPAYHLQLQRSPMSTLPLLRTNARLYGLFFVRQLGAQAIWAIFPLFLASIGANRTWIAVMDSINMLGQFVAMRFVDRLNSLKAITIGLVLSAVVFVSYGLSRNYLQLLPVQVLLSIAWSCLFVGSMSYLLKKNQERGAASGLLYSMTFLSAGIGPLVGGVISQVWGFSALMFAASGMSLAALWMSRRLE